MYPQDANAEFGRETMLASADLAIKEVHHRLEKKNLYRGHGNSLKEGLWKEDNSL
jgi:hypothetical protein